MAKIRKIINENESEDTPKKTTRPTTKKIKFFVGYVGKFGIFRPGFIYELEAEIAELFIKNSEAVDVNNN